jgi:hypothetical protein
MRQTRLLCLAGLLLSTLVQGAENATESYLLPSFSLVLNVDKSENALLVFQDHLDTAVQKHLDVFFQEKIEGMSLPNGYIDGVDLSSTYVWKELSHSTSNDSPNKYELRARFKCQLEVGYNVQDTAADVPISRISQSIMELLLIESFQGDNYWGLVHDFFRDEVLESITGMKITVQADGYVHYNGEDPAELEQYQTTGAWTAAMIVGVFIASLCFGMMIVMWTYLCCCTRNSLWVLLNNRRRHKKNPLDKPDSTTDDSHSSSSRHPEEGDEYEATWMDAWAKSITSIPLRPPVKPRKLKKHAASIRRPGRHHSSNLNAIVEVDDDSSTVCSVETTSQLKSVSSSQHSRTQSSNRLAAEATECTAVEDGAFSIQECDEQSDDDDDESVSSSATCVSLSQMQGSRKTASIPNAPGIV